MLSAPPLFTHAQALPLWPDGVMPGGLPDDPKDPRASYRPCLLLRLLSDCTQVRPLCIVCPGGGYTQHSLGATLPVAAWLNSLGLHAAILGYRVAPFRFPAPLLDIQRAIRLIRRNAADWGIDPRRIGTMGFSAGGHVAGMAATLHQEDHGHPVDELATISMRPDALITGYAVLSLVDHAHTGSVRQLLGEGAQADLAARLSVERRVDTHTPASFLWHTADDPVVPMENSLQCAAALRQHRIPLALHIFPSGPHSLVLAEGHPAGAWTDLAAEWLSKLGWR